MIAGMWFAMFAFVASALMYLVPSVQRDTPTVLLYLGYPTISGFVAGYALGPSVFKAGTPVLAATRRGLPPTARAPVPFRPA